MGQLPREAWQSPAQAWLPTSDRRGPRPPSNQSGLGNVQADGATRAWDAERPRAPAEPGLTRRPRLRPEHRAGRGAERGSQALASQIRGSGWFWTNWDRNPKGHCRPGAQPGKTAAAEQTACRTTPSHGIRLPQPAPARPPHTSLSLTQSQRAPTEQGARQLGTPTPRDGPFGDHARSARCRGTGAAVFRARPGSLGGGCSHERGPALGWRGQPFPGQDRGGRGQGGRHSHPTTAGTRGSGREGSLPANGTHVSISGLCGEPSFTGFFCHLF